MATSKQSPCLEMEHWQKEFGSECCYVKAAEDYEHNVVHALTKIDVQHSTAEIVEHEV
jgi:hypothetical protein